MIRYLLSVIHWHQTRYTHFSSAQSWKEKTAALKTLKHRALTYCSSIDLLNQELAHLEEVFIENGFPKPVVQRILSENPVMKEDTESQNSKDYSKSFVAPFHPSGKRLFNVLQIFFKIVSL